jgi:hypothetical protein
MAKDYIKPSRTQLQKGYRELEKFVLDPKLEKIVLEAAKSKSAANALKKDPLKYLVGKKVKTPLESRISATISTRVICTWICKLIHGHLICVRRCFVLPDPR